MQFTTNSGEAVPGLAGVSGTILVSSLIVLVIGLVVGVIAAIAARRTQNSEAVVGALTHVVRVAAGAAVIGSAGALAVGGSNLYQVDKVEAQLAESEESRGECSQPRTATVRSDTASDEVADLISDDWDRSLGGIEQARIQYWPDPSAGCEDNTVDACRMVHVTGTQGVRGGPRIDEWAPPAGECPTGDPEEVAF